jgi:hypothetical protein
MRSKSNVVKDEGCDGNSNNRSFQLQKPYQKAECARALHKIDGKTQSFV